MTSMEPTDNVDKINTENLSENIECPRCGTSLPPQAFYCSSCGKRIIKRQSQRKKLHAKNDQAAFLTENEAGEQTIRLSELPRRVREYYLFRAFHWGHSTEKTSHNAVSVLEREAPEKEETPSSTPSDDPPTVPLPTAPLPTAPLPAAPLATEKDVRASFFHRFRRSSIQDTPTTDLVSAPQQVTSWKWLTILSLTIAIGLLLVAAAFEAGRLALSLADPLFWTGLAVIYLPVAARLFSARPTRRERLALLVFLATALYLVKFLQYPLHFAYFDEFIHVRTTQDIMTTGHLFHSNPILPLSPYFPGLEIVASSLSSLTGLSIFASGTLIIGIAQLLTVLSLYHFYRLLVNSDRTAGMATVLYMANPGFLFDTAFAYESLALSLAVFVLFVVALRCFSTSEHRRGLIPVTWLALGAVVVTHHLTSYTLAGILLFWTFASLFLRIVGRLRHNPAWKNRMSVGPGEAGILAVGLCLAWLVFTGGRATGYLAQYPVAAVKEILQVLTGHASVRQLFHSSAGAAIPKWEPLLSYSSIVVILAGLAIGFFQAWKYHKASAVFLTLAGIALIYPVSLGFHLIPQGAEMAQRSTEFAFLGVGFLLTIGVVGRWLFRASRRRHLVFIAGLVGLVFLGQTVTGNGQVWARLPGPYLVVADQRSIEPEGIDAATWAAMYLGPGHSVATDRINMLLMSTYGSQWVPMAWNSNVSVQSIFADQQFGPDVWAALQQDSVQYVVVDRRLSTGLPQAGVYFDIPWTDSQPISQSALAKFDGLLYVNRVFDSGNIVIYDVEPLTNPAANSLSLHTLCAPAASNTGAPANPKVQNYQGTLYDTNSGITTTIQLNGTQQQSGNICGTFKVTPTRTSISGIPLNGSFGAAITPGGQVQLLLSGSSGTPSLIVIGQVTSNGTIAGTYCSISRASNSCSDYGVLNVSPVR